MQLETMSGIDALQDVNYLQRDDEAGDVGGDGGDGSGDSNSGGDGDGDLGGNGGEEE